jgi:DNA-binding MarR family transcriptional regulator
VDRRIDEATSAASDDHDAWESPLELQGYLPYRLAVTYNLVSRAFANQCRETTGLSIPEWRVLAVLGLQTSLTSQDVVQRTAMDKAKVSRAVSSLVDKGLVLRDGDPYDHRLNRLSMTPAGEEVYRAVVPMARSLEKRLTDQLSDDDMTLFNTMLDRLQEGARSIARS